MKRPSNTKELQALLGVLNYYRRFLEKFADREAVLRKCSQEWNWSSECEEAYQAAMQQVKSIPTLYPYYQDADVLELHTDASNLAVASVLVQKRRSEEHTSELQSLMRISYAVFCLKNKINNLIKYQLT